jgi:hypothetical protein
MDNHTSPLPYEGKDASSETRDVSAPVSRLSGFDFGLDTAPPRNSTLNDINEVHDLSPVESLAESHDQLVTGSSEGQHG